MLYPAERWRSQNSNPDLVDSKMLPMMPGCLWGKKKKWMVKLALELSQWWQECISRRWIWFSNRVKNLSEPSHPMDYRIWRFYLFFKCESKIQKLFSAQLLINWLKGISGSLVNKGRRHGLNRWHWRKVCSLGCIVPVCVFSTLVFLVLRQELISQILMEDLQSLHNSSPDLKQEQFFSTSKKRK
jgi:hypothetical protein